MYRTCLHCNRPLGQNDVIEAFPVGQRLAFDARRGRLWVICRSCRRWNLTPLEERWEAIEACERLFRESRRRISTDQIGLARARDGTDLVRIGDPQRPEFAAWRYGEVFRSRHRRARLLLTGTVVAGIAYAAGTIWGAAAMGTSLPLLFVDVPGLWLARKRGRRIIDRIETPKGIGIVRGRDAGAASLTSGSDGEPAVRIMHSLGVSTVEGWRARRLLARIMPLVNHEGGDANEVQRAVQRIEQAGSPEVLLARCAMSPHADDGRAARALLAGGAGFDRDARGWQFASYQRHDLLALEMSLHEATERAAMEGELQALEDAWKEAEEIAAIADDLLVPEGVTRGLRKLRGD